MTIFDGVRSAWAEADPLTLGILLVFALWSGWLILSALYHGLVQWWRNQPVEIPAWKGREYGPADRAPH